MSGAADAEAAKLKKFSDAGGLEIDGCPTQAETDSSGCFGIYTNGFKNREMARKRLKFEPGLAGAEAAQPG